LNEKLGLPVMAKRAMGKYSKIDDSLADCRATLDKCREILQIKAGAQIKQRLGHKPIEMLCWPSRSSARVCNVEAQNGEQWSKIIDSMCEAKYIYSCKIGKKIDIACLVKSIVLVKGFCSRT
jgi:hypothetical protein